MVLVILSVDDEEKSRRCQSFTLGIATLTIGARWNADSATGALFPLLPEMKSSQALEDCLNITGLDANSPVGVHERRADHALTVDDECARHRKGA